MKLILTFVAGAALAGGLVFLALRPEQPLESVQTTQPPIPELTPSPALVPSPAQAEPAATPAAPPPDKSQTPARPEPRPFRGFPVAATGARPAPLPLPPPLESGAAREPADIPVVPISAENVPPPPEPNRVVLGAGTLLTVILAEDLSTMKNVAGDTFTATLDQPLVIDGFVIAERGGLLQGRVVGTQDAGRVKGTAVLGLQLTRFNTSDGQRIPITTDTFEKRAADEKVKDAAKMGAAASIGAAIGAIAGGGKGAAIGAAIGGAAGAGKVLTTRGAPAELRTETRIPFRINAPVTITEKLH